MSDQCNNFYNCTDAEKGICPYKHDKKKNYPPCKTYCPKIMCNDINCGYKHGCNKRNSKKKPKQYNPNKRQINRNQPNSKNTNQNKKPIIKQKNNCQLNSPNKYKNKQNNQNKYQTNNKSLKDVKKEKSEEPRMCIMKKSCYIFKCAFNHPGKHTYDCTLHSTFEDSLTCTCIHEFDNDDNFLLIKDSLLTATRSEIRTVLYDAFSTLNNYLKSIGIKKSKLNNSFGVDKEIEKAKKEQIFLMKECKDVFSQYVANIIKNSNLNEFTQNDINKIERASFRLRPFNKNDKGDITYAKQLPALGEMIHIQKLVANNSVTIIPGETGSGKSTQIPQYLSELYPNHRILCTQPRKVAAVQLAERIQYEFNRNNNNMKNRDVGYFVGGKKKLNGKYIMLYTEQKLLDEITRNIDCIVTQYKVIIIDEAHERNIITDILLCKLKSMIKKYKKLRIVITSATINVDKFKNYFGNKSKSLEIKGRLFPIEIKYTPLMRTDSYIDKCVETCIEVSKTHDGDILAFLPGQNEVEMCYDKCSTLISDYKMKNIAIFQLYGKQPRNEQNKVFSRIDKKKIIFTTNIAETSITIPGVKCVIDCGVEKESYFDSKRNMKILHTTQISKNSAKQRAGRAGRTSKGYCFRLYSEETFNLMKEDKTPEILRSSLSVSYLILLKQGIHMENANLLDKPHISDIERTKINLIFLGALDANGTITDFGNFIVKYQLEPSVAKIIYEGKKDNLVIPSFILAALVDINIWWYSGSNEQKLQCEKKKKEYLNSLENENKVTSTDGDVISDFRVFVEWYMKFRYDYTNNTKFIVNEKKWCNKKSLSYSMLLRTLKVVKEYIKVLGDNNKLCKGAMTPPSDALKELICKGYFLNMCTRGIKTRLYSTLQGIPAYLHPSSNCTDEEFVIYQELLKTSRNWMIRSTPITIKLLETVLPIEIYNKFNKNCKNNKKDKIELEASKIILDKITGMNAENIVDIENKYSIILDFDKTNEIITIWGPKNNINKGYSYLKQLIEKYTKEIKVEVEEYILCGNTRLIIGSGANIEKIFIANDLSKLFISKLPKNYEETSLLKHILQHLQKNILIEEFRSKFFTINIFSSINSSNAVLLIKDPELGKEIIDKIEGTFINNNRIECTTSGFINSSSVEFQEISFSLRWPCGKSTNTGIISFLNMECANNALQYYKKIPDINQTGIILSPPGNLLKYPINDDKIGYKEEKEKSYMYSKYSTYRLRLSNIPDSISECMLRELFSIFGVVDYCSIVRTELTNNLDSDFYNHDSIVYIKSAAFTQNFRTTEIAPSNYLKGHDAIMNINEGIESVARVNDIINDNLINNQPAQATLRVGYKISCHSELFKSLEPLFNKIIDSIRIYNVIVQCKKEGIDQHIHLHVLMCYRDKAKNLELLKAINKSKLAFQRILKPKKYAHKHLNRLFSIKGSIFLVELDKKCKEDPYKIAYIHWSKQKKTILLYGEDKAIDNTEKELNNHLDKFNNSTTFTIYYPIKSRRNVVTMIRNIKSMPNCFMITLDKKKCSVTFHCLPKSIEKIKEEIKKYVNHFKDSPYKNIKRELTEYDRCSICCYDITHDDISITYQICRHRVHKECLESRLIDLVQNDRQAMIFPITCDYSHCNANLALRDITSYISSNDFNILIKASFENYLSKNKNYFNCFGVNCDQIFPINLSEFHCDNCNLSYCVNCCIKKNEPILLHPGIDCNEIISEDTLDFTQIKGICCCPVCRSPIEKNSGCYHMKCSSIQCKNKTHFCWGCLKVKNGNCSEMPCSKKENCDYIYHHMGYCSRPINK